MTVIYIVFLMIKVLSSHLTRRGTIWKNVKQNRTPHVVSSLQRFAEVSFRQLDQKGRKEFEVAKSAEIQSWLRYEAVTAALRSQYHDCDIMKMRWVL